MLGSTPAQLARLTAAKGSRLSTMSDRSAPYVMGRLDSDSSSALSHLHIRTPRSRRWVTWCAQATLSQQIRTKKPGRQAMPGMGLPEQGAGVCTLCTQTCRHQCETHNAQGCSGDAAVLSVVRVAGHVYASVWHGTVHWFGSPNGRCFLPS
jgi:hypothetical protein